MRDILMHIMNEMKVHTSIDVVVVFFSKLQLLSFLPAAVAVAIENEIILILIINRFNLNNISISSSCYYYFIFLSFSTR